MALIEPRKSLLDLPGGEAAKTTSIHLSPLTAQRFATRSTTTISLADPEVDRIVRTKKAKKRRSRKELILCATRTQVFTRTVATAQKKGCTTGGGDDSSAPGVCPATGCT
jgi:hypothetical protein